jgi:hypothetical protein
MTERTLKKRGSDSFGDFSSFVVEMTAEWLEDFSFFVGE